MASPEPLKTYTPRYCDRSYFNTESKSISLASEVIGHLSVDCELLGIRVYRVQDDEEHEAVVLHLRVHTTRYQRTYVTWADVQLQFGERESALNLTHCEPNTIKGNNQERHVTTHYNLQPNINVLASGGSLGNAERTTEQTKISTWKFECSRKPNAHPQGHYHDLRLALFVPDELCSESFSERSLIAAAVLDLAKDEEVKIQSSCIDGKASTAVPQKMVSQESQDYSEVLSASEAQSAKQSSDAGKS
ncbi:hypothetical protein LTR91_019980 [Friedmanniomyces endolithicus]|uniref:Uncharacterized protein n=1 Tax=Friedmanniomyces endolithicus TaxID=329885 RepID=A0AAN6H8N8_9PEZI|nr:hypothetical protein LTR57_015603 [Friedmanniomyces endolithicus]KAK0961251.1 hypothetical protein LTR91_019980 [Friedmanniomyces endolithicus]KAK0985656.1 hypothetical protein LTS01_010138 [Friedmanniomyces endolithicus]KAK1029199.1 hypothetical protein LTS16_019954 [Friedmanniomyces endolithicus]